MKWKKNEENKIYMKLNIKSNTKPFNCKNNKFNKEIIKRINFILTYFYSLINIFYFLYIPKCTSKDISLKTIIHLSEIVMKINGTGKKNILSKDYHIMPDEIIINGEKQNISKEYYMENETNIIKLKWNNSIKNCSYMFYSNYIIVEIDLSKFEASNTINMFRMFGFCTSLKYVNFTNINTSSVINMSEMFSNCESLTSLDLRSFDTSKVIIMSGMFAHCDSLHFIDLSNFDTSKVYDMGEMFKECYSLKSLNLSNFNTSNINNMINMFLDCQNLESLEIDKFDTSKVTYMGSMFENCRK